MSHEVHGGKMINVAHIGRWKIWNSEQDGCESHWNLEAGMSHQVQGSMWHI